MLAPTQPKKQKTKTDLKKFLKMKKKTEETLN